MPVAVDISWETCVLCNFCDPKVVTFCLCNNFMYLILKKEHFTFHSGMFANRKYEERPYPKHQKMCEPILVTLWKMWPQDSQSSLENVTLSSGTSPLASYKRKHPPPPPGGGGLSRVFSIFQFPIMHSFPPKFYINYCCEMLLEISRPPERISQQKFMQNLGGKQSALWGIEK